MSNQSKKRLFMWVGALTFTSIIIVFLLFAFLTSKQERLSYFQINHPVIFQGEVYSIGAIHAKEQVYIPLSFIKDYIDHGATFDEASQSVIIINNENILRFPIEKLEKFVNEQPIEIEVETFISEKGELYIELEQLKNIYPIDYIYSEETKALLIFKAEDAIAVGVALKDSLRLKEKPTLFANYYDVIQKGEEVYIEAEAGSHYYVRKKNGVSGYIRKKDLTLNESPYKIDSEYEKPFQSKQLLDEPINLTWEAVYTTNPDLNEIGELPGVDVVSPTWFHLKNGDGDIQNLGQMSYVHWAKDRGYQIWGLFSNDFDPDKTHESLQNYETRQKMIRQLLQYSAIYQLDGINVDFENVYYGDKDLVTQFMRELTALAHQAGLIISMDITFISTSEMWSMFYDRAALSEIVDYIVLMAYDEHWGTSPVAGSVASFPWVEKNLEKLLEIVPHDRLILGIPTYTRLWKEQETAGGNIEVSSQAISMNAANEWVKQRQLTPLYDEESGQNYVEYYDETEKATYKIWLEDEYSVRKRAQMVHDYELAGVATWNRYFANEAAWRALDETLKLRH